MLFIIQYCRMAKTRHGSESAGIEINGVGASLSLSRTTTTTSPQLSFGHTALWNLKKGL